MSERPTHAYSAGDEATLARRYTEEPVGPLELFVMSAACELHDDERPGAYWFGLVRSSVTSYCRRAIEARGVDWKWIMEAIARERQQETIDRR